MSQPQITLIEEPPSESVLFKYLKRPAMGVAARALKQMHGRFLDEVQLFNAECVTDYEGPVLWLPKHETSLDFFLLYHWMDLPSQPDIRIVKRKPRLDSLSGIGEWVLDHILLWPFIVEVGRASQGDTKNERDAERTKIDNQRKLAAIAEKYHHGVHAIMWPEGTTSTDGTIYPIKAGCYYASVLRGDSGIETVAFAPIGLTVDLLSGRRLSSGKNSHLIFVNFSRPFLYEPVQRRPNESNGEYIRADVEHHTRRIREAYIDLNVYTAAQLGGEYLVRLAQEKGKQRLTLDNLCALVSIRAEAVSKLPNTAVDYALGSKEGLMGRVENMFGFLHRFGYMEDGVLNSERVLFSPDPKKVNFKQQNPLLFCANRLHDVMDRRFEVAQIMQGTYDLCRSVTFQI
ncbi:hypothetical protein HYV81_01595 [Candidatus Woesearchaeota archaeon]|nr:hypothetical protein [Candidatus Woesearchaeota archaeon]